MDDEPPARRRILSLLKTDSEISVVGECADGEQALHTIEALKPDLVFLDVQMPERDGFSVVEALKVGPKPLFVFATAYDRYAVKAFEAHALDYLLKPFSRARFRDSLDRAKQHIFQRAGAGAYDQQLSDMLKEWNSHPRSLPLKSRGKIVFVATHDIDWIEADSNYIRVHAGQETHLVRDKISAFEEKLDPEQFLRVHRSFIVNTAHIRELLPCNAGEYIVVLRSGKELPCGRTYRDDLDRLIAGRAG